MPNYSTNNLVILIRGLYAGYTRVTLGGAFPPEGAALSAVIIVLNRSSFRLKRPIFVGCKIET